ncbi:unnamed protein product [Schistosoma mattheei]|uniref:Uncharacterized protein n=1 Tax=Schistosoma mattheei TaxID=31246 RepID=A0A183PVH4_9TREM|nr:unnamed protein product [Schistosoma mattheei]
MSPLKLDHHGKHGSIGRSFRPSMGLLSGSAHPRSRTSRDLNSGSISLAPIFLPKLNRDPNERDLENERIWTHEKLLLADNTYIGRSLFAVNQLIRQHQLLIKEVANRRNRMEIAIQDADNIITKFQSTFEIFIDDDCKTIQQSKIRSSEKTMTIQTDNHSMIQIELSTDIGVKYKIPKKILIDLHTLVIELRYDLKNLIDRMSTRTERLNIGFQCFTHIGEFAELRSWLQECEDMLLLESRASRDTITAKTELKKHAHIEFRVNTLLANCVCDFSKFYDFFDHYFM